ncbi:MAG: TraB/GumN family protein [Cyclobacteriaceae bacterium]
MLLFKLSVGLVKFSRPGLRLCLVFLLLFGHGQNSSAQKLKSSLLWKIEGKNFQKPSYLFGTIHIICPNDFEMFQPVKEAVESSELMFLELDMDDSTLMASMQIKMLNPGMRNFSQDLDVETKKVLNEFFIAHFGVGLDRLGIMKPFSLMTMMNVKYIECAAPLSYENALIEQAKLNAIEVMGLEDLDFQLGLFDQIPQEEMIKWLVEGTDIEENKKMFSEMISTYKTKDVENIYKFSMENSPEFKAYEDMLLIGRNKDWIPKIISNASKQPTFFAVGAGHLGGKSGIISLLKKEGYKLTPIKL